MADIVSVKNGFLRSPMFVFLLGQVALLILWLGSFSVAWGKLSYQFTEIQEWRKYTDLRLEQIDKEGTTASKYGIQSEKAILDQHELRLRNVEEQTKKTDVIIEKISRIEEALKDIRANQGIKK